MTHRCQFTVYYEDTDAGGVVYYANYLKFAERARTEWLRSLGHEQRHLLETEGVAFVVRRCTTEFLKPARLDDVLTLETRVTRIKRASLELSQSILLGDSMLVTLDVTLACVSAAFRPCPIPGFLRDLDVS